MLANQITEQPIYSITKTTSSEEDGNKCPGPDRTKSPDHLSDHFKMVAGSVLGTRLLLVVVGVEVGVGMGVLFS